MHISNAHCVNFKNIILTQQFKIFVYKMLFSRFFKPKVRGAYYRKKKVYNHLFSASCFTIQQFYKDGFDIKYPMKADVPLSKKTQTNKDLCCFILFIYFLRLWLKAGMDNGPIIWIRVFDRVRIGSFSIFEWFLFSLYTQTVVLSYFSRQKSEGESIKIFNP